LYLYIFLFFNNDFYWPNWLGNLFYWFLFDERFFLLLVILLKLNLGADVFFLNLWEYLLFNRNQ
jgi:hypothetical protein